VERIVYTPVEVAELLGVDKSTVHRWMNSGVLPSIRMGDTGRKFIPKRPLHEMFGMLDELTSNDAA
jgi:excisionase family DNA binding protein